MEKWQCFKQSGANRQKRFQKMTHVSESESASAKTRNAVSPYDVYASMRIEIEGYWHIYDKRFDKSFVFYPNNTIVQTDETTGKNYLIAGAPTGGLTDAR